MPVMTPVELLLSKLSGVKKSGKGWDAICPAHEDRRASLSVGVADDGRPLLHCHAGCDTSVVLAAIGLTWPDLFPKDGTVAKIKSKAPAPAFQTANEALKALEATLGKHSSNRHTPTSTANPWGFSGFAGIWPDGKVIRPVSKHSDGWRIGAMPSPRPLYNLPEVVKADLVLVVEGEKAAEEARKLGYTPTTSAGGANAAKQTDWRPLAGKKVWILPDNDESGSKYAEDVTKAS